MNSPRKIAQSRLPSVDAVLRMPNVVLLMENHGRTLVTNSVREVLKSLRSKIRKSIRVDTDPNSIFVSILMNIEIRTAPGLQKVFNLTGTVLHTNLGRSPLPQTAIDAINITATGSSNLEFDLKTGRRGDRDNIIEHRLCRITGAEAATVVNNNAAAVMLLLNSLANRKEVPVSRGELVEIGGSFRIPDIMSRSGAKLIEVGTTNRTHLKDYQDAIGRRTGLLMKVHTSNYAIQGFTASVSEDELAKLAHANNLPLAVDLGSGALVDMRKFGLPHERTPMETLADGADIVTFSGDKLLGGPQAGLIIGKKALLKRLKKNPFKRAIRCDKLTLAALDAVLGFYETPEKLADEIPSIRLLSRKTDDIKSQAERIAPILSDKIANYANIEIHDCMSQIGSGALPTQELPSIALSLLPISKGNMGMGSALKHLSTALRLLRVPVIGRIERDRLLLDLRCLEDEADFLAQFDTFGSP